MRLDYFCRVSVRDLKGNTLSARTLRWLNGVIDDEYSNFTLYMDDILEHSDLQGEPVKYVYNRETSSLYARVSFHEKEALKDIEIEILTEYVEGQFLDGYGEDEIEISKWSKKYVVAFDHAEITGPVKVDVKRPKLKPQRENSKNAKLKQLIIAVMNGDLERVESLLDEGVPINGVPSKEDLHDTVHCALGWAANRDQFEIARKLLGRGADPNVQGGRGETPLMCTGSIEMLELLLENGANANIREVNGQNAAEYHEAQADFWKQQGMFDHYQKRIILAERLRLANN